MIHSRIKVLENEVGLEKEGDLGVDQGIEGDDRGLKIDEGGLGREIEAADEGAGLGIGEVGAETGLDGIEEVGLLVEKVRKRQLV